MAQHSTAQHSTAQHSTAQQGLSLLLADFQQHSLSEREKGTYFENLIQLYLQNEPFYSIYYKEVLTFKDWIEKYYPNLSSNDTGIDLVAVTHDGENHAIQCKNYAQDHRISKADIDSFFTASGKSYFQHRIIVVTTDHWTENAYASLSSQNPPVTVINRSDLEHSAIDWENFAFQKEISLKPKKSLREHQKSALSQVRLGLKNADRGKLIMACGTGKTFTSLKIAENIAGNGKKVLFLVPSLALLSQSLTEWTQESEYPLHCFAVCSDSDVGKQGKAKNEDDRVQQLNHELQYPATTNAKSLIKALNAQSRDLAMTVVFSTYHSIDVIHQAQQQGLGEFDLIICDEAHRTTGASFDDKEESAFVRVHNNDYIKAQKRLYMTATPRIYTEDAKKTEGVTVYSMDDETKFGQDLYTISFSSAVKQNLLVDYKVLVLAVEESHIHQRLEKLFEGTEIQVDDAAKIVGCWKALSKYGIMDELGDEEPMKRAVAFCQVIEKEYKGKTHKVSSKNIAEIFSNVVDAYQKQEIAALEEQNPDFRPDNSLLLKCEAEHVDGGMNASEKSAKIEWLKAEQQDNTCRILSNVRCLSEGVDVPALDAVLFLTPRSSQVDVVQSVGRVMRNAPGKKRGYVILPVVIPAGIEPDKALEKNENYKVVWQVLNALRAHDDRFDAMINKMEFDGAAKDKIEVISVVSQVLAKQKQKPTKTKKPSGKGEKTIGNRDNSSFNGETQLEIEFEIGEIERALTAKIVKKCGNRTHWEDWANDVAKIANTHIERINTILANPQNTQERSVFNAFLNELRDDLNNAITESEAVEMLAQHLITKPVFDALFANDNFTQHNPMSQAMQKVVDIFEQKNLATETKQLNDFYESIQFRVKNIQSPEGKQKIIKELYDSFFNKAFPKMAERLGIVYTPVEVVDFIIHSVENVLNNEFNASLADKGVQIIDPFTGTGTFITRLLQSGIIPAKKLPLKYHEIHANEIVLLAYYIAAINIESVYHALLSEHSVNTQENSTDYQPFEGICLTDTFQMYEKEDLVDEILQVNSDRRKRQKALDIQVIIGNPPYSIGQSSANDNNQNIDYPNLNKRLEETYVKFSNSNNNKSIYDSYIRAIRWASDRIGNNGVIGFVTNSGYLESNSADGLRKCLTEEFSSLYIFHLRGNARTSGERRRKEKDNIFGQGTRTPVAISILVKNPNAEKHGQTYFHDIGDYLNREQKLDIIGDFQSINGISVQQGWTQIIPNQFNDWLNQRDPNFDTYLSITDNIFKLCSYGITTSRDSWCYNYSYEKLNIAMENVINFYNKERLNFHSKKKMNSLLTVDDVISHDAKSISWSRSLKNYLKNDREISFNEKQNRVSLYRPFTKTNLYFDKSLNEYVYQLPLIFPITTLKNKVITITGLGTPKEFSVIMTDVVPDVQLQANGQCFPLYLYEKEENNENYQRRDAITDEAIAHFKAAYPSEDFSKEDMFYYIYGLLHSEEYREKYADNLSKQLPRIPCVKSAVDFWAFSQAGRELAELHLNYETVPMYQDVLFKGGLKLLNDQISGGISEDFYVEKMKFGKKIDEETGKKVDDKTTIIYNSQFTLANIPEEAYDYVVNGKPALEWVMERQSVKTDKASGIVNDANDWAIETMNNPRYPMELFLRVVTASLETMRIVRALPKLDMFIR
ncbi:type III restriction protein res subunit [Haemophilus parahaemolyticus]|uniref:Type III restriction protein res subunit n=1 Tax=Haemophilus parahaemolyticus TaxID=735 RepID=A0A377I0R6_HAEPH|nr:type ISP restriction/modification enzyme [Haemophilus parahaemolyticus]STO63560.1 type III restriction protein res subunit [Haemophilus parahaemolyticus]